MMAVTYSSFGGFRGNRVVVVTLLPGLGQVRGAEVEVDVRRGAATGRAVVAGGA